MRDRPYNSRLRVISRWGYIIFKPSSRTYRSRAACLLIVIALIIPTAAFAAGKNSKPPKEKKKDLITATTSYASGTFRVEATQIGPLDWTVSSPATTSTSNGVTGTNTPGPEVVAWNPATRQLQVRLSATLDQALTGARLVIDWVSPSYEATVAPDGVFVEETCLERFPAPGISEIRPFDGDEGYGPWYGECFELGDIAAGSSVSAVVPFRVGQPTSTHSSFGFVYHIEDAAKQHRVGLSDEFDAPGKGKLLPPSTNGHYFGIYTDRVGSYDRKLNRFSAKIGRPATLIYSVEHKMPHLTGAELVDGMEQAAARGAILAKFIGVPQFDNERQHETCGEITWHKIINSACDGFFDQVYLDYAVAVRDSGLPVVLSTVEEGSPLLLDRSFGSEGNEDWKGKSREEVTQAYGDPALPDGPERFRDFHRHVVDLFNSVGAYNVTWTHEFRPLDIPGDCGTGRWWFCPEYLYAGDEYVDWVGLNYVNFGGGQTFGGGFSPDHLITDNARDLNFKYTGPMGYSGWQETAPDKPIFSPNTYPSVPVQELRDDRSAMFNEVFDLHRESYPNVKMMSWWDDQSDLPSAWFIPFQSVDIGFFHRSEADAIRNQLATNTYTTYPVAPQTASDVTAPSQVNNLSSSGATLTWTAPGDDGGAGTASSYSVRCIDDAASLTTSNWSRSGTTLEVPAPVPAAAGATQTVTVSLPGDGSFNCALTATDDVNQTSQISNVASVTGVVPPPPPPPDPDPDPTGPSSTTTAHITLMNPLNKFRLGATKLLGNCPADEGPWQGIDGWWIKLADGSVGKDATLKSAPAEGDTDVHFFDATCTPTPAQPMVSDNTWNEAGKVPTGAKWALVAYVFGPGTDFTFNLY